MPSTAYRIKKKAPSTHRATVRFHPSHPPTTVAYVTPAERDAAVVALAHAAAPALAHAVRLTRYTLVGADGVERGGPGMRRALVAAALVRAAEIVEHG